MVAEFLRSSSKTWRKGTGSAEGPEETGNVNQRKKMTSCIIHFRIYDAENNVRNFAANSWSQVKEAK